MQDYYEEFSQGALPAVKPLDEKWYEEQEAKKDKSTISELIGPALGTMPTTKLVDKAYEMYARPEAVPEYQISKETNSEIMANYDKDSADYLRESTSPQDFKIRKSIIDLQVQDMRTLAKGGLTGMGLVLGANLLDPVSLAIGSATGGLGFVAKATGVSKIARAAAVAGISNAAIESVVAATDPHYHMRDFVLNTALGALVGGAFHAKGNLFLNRVKEDAEDAIIDAVSNIHADSVMRHADIEVPGILGRDMERISTDIDAHTQSLRERSGGAISGTELKGHKTELKRLESEYEANYSGLKKSQEELTGLRNKSIESRKEYIDRFNRDKAKIDTKYQALLEDAQNKLKKAEKQLLKATGKKAAKANARHWEAGNSLDILKEQHAAEVKSAQVRHERSVRRADKRLEREFNRQTNEIRAVQENLRDQITEKRLKIEQARSARATQREHNIWKGSTQEERIKMLYGDNVPMKMQVPEAATNKWVSQKDISVGAGTGTPVPEIGSSTGAAASSDFPAAFKLTLDDVSKFRSWGGIGEKLPNTLKLMKTKGMKAISSMHNILTNSKSMEMRGLASKIVQGGGEGRPTVDVIATIEDRTMRAAMKGRVEPAFEGWMKLNGNNIKDIVFRPEFRDNFNKQVFLAIHDPSSAANEFVKEAAEAYADLFETALSRQKKYGVKAFMDITPNRNYVPKILSQMKLKGKLTNARLVRDLLAKGYMEGEYKLARKGAEALADAQIYRNSHQSLTLMESLNRSSIVNSSELSTILKASGVPESVIRDMEEKILDTKAEMMMSDRARFSFGINPATELEGMTVADLLETNLPSITDRYVKDAAFDTALARMGWKSRAHLENDLELIRKGMTNGIPYTGQTVEEVEKEVQLLRDHLTLVQGRSIDKTAGTTLGKSIRRIQGYAGLVRLNQIGVSTIPEAARAWSTRPWHIMQESMSHLKVFGSKNMRKGSKWSGKLERSDWDEMDTVLQYAGDDHVLYGQGLRSEVLEEGLDDGRIGKIIDNALAYGKHAQGIASGFRMIQGGLERFSVTSIGTKITESALHGNKLFTQAERLAAGWDDEFFESIMDHVRTNGKPHTLSSGKVINTINVEAMTPDMFDKFQLGVHLLASREMQKLYVGETPRYMHTFLGGLLTQFRSFSLGSLEKQLLYDVKYNRSRGMLIALNSIFLAGLAHGVKTMLGATGRKDADKYIENRMSGMNLAWGIVGGMGQLGVIEPAMDIAATIGMVPDTLMASPGKRGAAPLGVRSIPAFGLVSDVAKTSQDIFGTLKGTKKDVNFVKDIRNITAFSNMVGMNQLFNMIE